MKCLSLFLFVSLGATALPSARADEAPRPNIIFFFVDDLGWGDLGLNFQNTKSGKKHRTPELDKMAEEGARMLRHYCPAPVCAPSRSSLLSGLHQGHANVRDNQFDKALADNHNLATVLKGAGYRSALVGKYGLMGKGNKKPAETTMRDWVAYPTKRGFDEFFGYVRHIDGHVHYPADRWEIGNSKSHKEPKELWHNDEEISSGFTKCFTVDLFTAFTKKWIVDHQKASPDQPFFIYLAHDTPHGALQVATGPYPDGGGLKGGVQWVGEENRMINTATGTIDSFIHPDYRHPEWSEVEQRFASLVRRIDESMGDLLQLLRDLKIADNTMVVFTSDNGPHSESYIQGKNYRPTSFQSYGGMDGMKRDCWEGGIRVPTLAWWPAGIPGGREDRQPSQFHDWMATFAEAAGVPVPALSDGVSLLPQLTGKGEPEDSTVYVEYSVGGSTPKYEDYLEARRGKKRGQMQVLFQDGYKGIRVNVKGAEDDFEIYDVDQDPGERNNLAGSSEDFQKLNRAMKDRVLRLRRTNNSAKRPYDRAAVPAVEVANVEPGARWEVRKGDFAWVPRLEGEKPTKTVTSSGLHEAELPAGAVTVGRSYLKVPSNGVYRFHFKTNGKAVVRIHEAILFDADFGYHGEEQETSLKLEAGLHPITLTLKAGEEKPEWHLAWTGADQKGSIPADAFFRNR
ncbi:MAG: sulfatase-like hydrolase/transferase [Verrucomicrobiota bacterium]